MANFELSPAAVADIENAIAWYQDKNKVLAQDFAGRLAQAFRFLAANPEAGQVSAGRVRHWPIRRFPYLIYYDLSGGQPYILAVLHQAQNPAILAEHKPSE